MKSTDCVPDPTQLAQAHAPQLPPPPQPKLMGEPPFAFPLTSAMRQAQWPHPNTTIVHVPHGSHLTLLLVYQRCYQEMVNAYGSWGPTWPPLEEKEASLKKIFTLNGYKNPGVDVWCAIYRAWDHYSLEKHTPAGSHGPRSPGSFEFASAPRTWYQDECAHRYQGRIQGVTLAPHLRTPRGGHGGHGAPSPKAAYAASPQETYRSAAAALQDATDPHWVVSDLAVSPSGVQILLEHPREAATVVDLGDLEATLLSKPSWGLRILAALAEHIKDRKVGVSQCEKRNKQPLVKSGW